MRFLFFSLSLFVGLALLTSCSRTDLAYKFADTYITVKTDDYFSLTSAQKKEFSKDIKADLDRIRQKSFPILAQQFRDLEKWTTQSSITAPELESIFKQVQDQIMAVGKQFSDSSLKLALQLNDSQYDYFQKQVYKHIKENEEDFKDPKDLVKESSKRYRKMLNLWLGDLNSDQKHMLEDFIKAKPFPWQLRNQNKEFLMKNFLEARKKPDTLKAYIQNFYSHYDTMQLPAYHKALLAYEADARVFFVSFWKTFTPDQRKYLHDALEKRAEDLDRLSKEKP